MRKVKTLKDQSDSPAGFQFAVCEVRSGADSEIIARFKNERDAKLFAEAEKAIAELKSKLETELAHTSTVARRAYVRGCMGL